MTPRDEPTVSTDSERDAARSRAPRRTVGLAIMLGAAVLGALVSLLLGPHAMRLGDPGGDAALQERVDDLIAGDDAGLGDLVVGTLDGDAQAVATYGADVAPETRFELGSITKTFTGHLLAAAIDEGEVALDDRLGAHLDELEGTPIGDVTLEELTTHTAGLPSIAIDPASDLVVTTESTAGRALSVYAQTTEEVIAAAAGVSPDASLRGTMAYSNLGVSLLGHALARAADAPDWSTLVDERLLEPLGMTSTDPATSADVASLASPHLSGGLPVDPWMHAGSGYAPAGVGITSTASDLLRYAEAILDGTAPGMAALAPLGEPIPIAPGAPEQRVGMGWMIVDAEGSSVAWHNGGTGGTRTAIAIDLDAQRAAVVLNASTRDVTGLAQLLVGAEGWPVSLPDVQALSSGVVSLLGVAQLLLSAIFARSRLVIASWFAVAVASVVTLALTAPWATLPGWLLGGSIGLLAGAATVGVRRWPHLRTLPRTLIVRILAVALALVVALNLAWTIVIVGLRLGL